MGEKSIARFQKDERKNGEAEVERQSMKIGRRIPLGAGEEPLLVMDSPVVN